MTIEKAMKLAGGEAHKHEVIAKTLCEDILISGHAEIAEALKMLVSFCGGKTPRETIR